MLFRSQQLMRRLPSVGLSYSSRSDSATWQFLLPQRSHSVCVSADNGPLHDTRPSQASHFMLSSPKFSTSRPTLQSIGVQRRVGLSVWSVRGAAGPAYCTVWLLSALTHIRASMHMPSSAQIFLCRVAVAPALRKRAWVHARPVACECQALANAHLNTHFQRFVSDLHCQVLSGPRLTIPSAGPVNFAVIPGQSTSPRAPFALCGHLFGCVSSHHFICVTVGHNASRDVAVNYHARRQRA